MTTILTVGHSTRPLDELDLVLREHGIQMLADVRTLPRSRRNPQFNGAALASSLAARGIVYVHRPDLGGLRRPREDSTNIGLPDEGFRGFADYMQTGEFEHALTALIEAAEGQPLAIMCAEQSPWKCHRSLVSDALTARGVRVTHALQPGRAETHRLSPAAVIDGAGVRYPARAGGARPRRKPPSQDATLF